MRIVKGKRYFVRAIGKESNKDGEPKLFDEAVEELKKLYSDCMHGHENDDYYEEAYLEVCPEEQVEKEGCQMTIVDSQSEYYQCAYILPVNDADGTDYILEEIQRAAEAAATYANEYEYRTESMQDVYDELQHIRELAHSLEQMIKSPGFRRKIFMEESKIRIPAAHHPIDLSIVVDTGMITDVCVSSHLEAGVDVRIIDLDTTDPDEKEAANDALDELRKELKNGTMRQEY